MTTNKGAKQIALALIIQTGTRKVCADCLTLKDFFLKCLSILKHSLLLGCKAIKSSPYDNVCTVLYTIIQVNSTIFVVIKGTRTNRDLEKSAVCRCYCVMCDKSAVGAYWSKQTVVGFDAQPKRL